MSQRMNRSRHAGALLLRALRAPETLPTLSSADWDLLLRAARHTRLLGRLDADLAARGLIEQLPERVAHHLHAARCQVQYQQRRLTWEVDRILRALDGVPVEVVALKGVAYVLAETAAARGRLFSDVDLLIAEDGLAEVEQRLRARGWQGAGLSRYDERYYREWMHELPPLRHLERDTEIDLHHRLLPRTNRLHFDPAPLFAASCKVAGHESLRVLGAPDMVLHAVLHLFMEGDRHEGLRLRDLVDVWDLLGQFRGRVGFWPALLDRAEQFGLQRPLFHALHHVHQLFVLELPVVVEARLRQWRPAPPLAWLMTRLVRLSLLPDADGRAPLRVRGARTLIFARAHWLRMPSWLLLRHLGYKGSLQLRTLFGG
ncbi:nucleotidyltransferase domain-containing protein [Marichromatium bheemlicum]|uniref:Nucleotidyltransferase family protein n=1 Tax=Marichromatium bheemlicum TaxID=365339 RepID=A0ABX1I820_9GAMM|nr:nucleotidyltransferase family protein [Marichromatium bheemlicum]NKN33368.1 nucleotidyltransferase family protein [Marichromatium bheemlicum]